MGRWLEAYSVIFASLFGAPVVPVANGILLLAAAAKVGLGVAAQGVVVIHVKLQRIVASKLIVDWSPEQISGWLKSSYPDD